MMTPQDLLIAYALFGIPLGICMGLLLGLVARHANGWGGYASFRRRAARLGHISQVMLPLIGGFYAMLLDGAELDTWFGWVGSGLWVMGGLLLGVSLFLAAWQPRLKIAMPVPATAVFVGAVCFAMSRFLG